MVRDPAYLETQKPENVPWYHRFGFEVVEQLDVGRAPPMWTMRREPRSTHGRAGVLDISGASR